MNLLHNFYLAVIEYL